MNSDSSDSSQDNHYWNRSLRIVFVILAVWAAISLGCGVLFRTQLDSLLPNIGGAPFGFWIAQQGAIIVFWILLVVYMFMMNRLDKEFGFGEEKNQ
jgi:putative solute:sodium symporter small subunit